MTDDQLAALERLAGAATPGPWAARWDAGYAEAEADMDPTPGG